MANLEFPFDVFKTRDFPGSTGSLIERVRPISMFPPFPWGQWAYARALRERCADLPGDVLEAGVGMGGMSLFLALLLEQLNDPRHVFGVDTFEGLPMPDAQRDNPYFREGLYAPATSLSDPLTFLFAKSRTPALDCFEMRAAELRVAHRVTAVQGLFDEVLPSLASDRTFCFVHIDGDLFESVYSALEHLWDRVEDGGIVAIDDFFHPGQGPLRATAQFFNELGATPLYHVVFPYSVCIVKEEWGRPLRAVDGNAYSLDWLRGDAFFLRVLRESLNASEHPRASANCALLLDALERPEDAAAIYDYWRALEPFWSRIDVRPTEWAYA